MELLALASTRVYSEVLNTFEERPRVNLFLQNVLRSETAVM